MNKIPTEIKNIHSILLPVAEIAFISREDPGRKILFLGRCETAKGYGQLPLIAEKLNTAGSTFSWHIVGAGSLDVCNQKIWNTNTDVIFYGELSSENVYRLLSSFDFLVLPTFAEGMPVSIIEAMKAGVVPIVNDLEGGIREILVNGKNGFRVPNNDPNGFAEILIKLNTDVKLFHSISHNAANYANKSFNPEVNTSLIEDIIIQTSFTKKLKIGSKIYGSFLDEPWIPNWLVIFFRLCKSTVKNSFLNCQ